MSGNPTSCALKRPETRHLHLSEMLIAAHDHIPANQKKKPLDFSRGFCITGGSGEIRTRDQRIKRSRGSSLTYISIGLAGGQNDRAIECAIAF